MWEEMDVIENHNKYNAQGISHIDQIINSLNQGNPDHWILTNVILS